MKQAYQMVFLLCLIAPTCFSKVVTKFSECIDFFVDATTPDIPGILHGGAIQDQNVYKGICQVYGQPVAQNQFATLYDTSNKIPVFSAYTYKGKHSAIKRPPWREEPELGNNQAKIKDYLGESEEESRHRVNRGHIFPAQHAHNKDSAESTFTLTNIVPQKLTFNGGSWCSMEDYVRGLMDNNCLDNNNKPMAYVVTGAVPGTEKMKNRVRIPKLMWTAFCCYNRNLKKWVSKAHWADNVDEQVGNTPKRIITPRSLANLYNELNNYYPGQKGKTFKVFPDKCLNDLNVPSPSPTEVETRTCHDQAVCDSEPDNVSWYQSWFTPILRFCNIV